MTGRWDCVSARSADFRVQRICRVLTRFRNELFVRRP